MVEPVKDGKDRFNLRAIMGRFFKGLFKVAIAYTLFAAFSILLAPFESVYASAFPTILVGLFLFFIFAIELTRDTILQHVLSIANSLMIMLYFAIALNTSVITMDVQRTSLMIDIHFFLALLVLGGLLGFAKSMLQLLRWLGEREEEWLKRQMK